MRLIHTVPNLPSQDKSIIRKWCSFRIKSELRTNKPAFEWFIAFYTCITSMEKNVCFITASQVDTGTVADEQSVLLSWGVGVFRSSSIQEKALNKSYDKKEEITCLHCQIPAPFTVLVVVISNTEKGLVLSHWSVTDQIVVRFLLAASSIWPCQLLVHHLHFSIYSIDCH